MKILLSTLLVCISVLGSAQGQTSGALIAQLRSSDVKERVAAAENLMTDQNRSAEANTALIALLSKEGEAVREAYREGIGASGKYGEGYSEYVARLGEVVMAIADKGPQRTDVWPALLNSPYDPESAFARWLAGHGDKATPFLLVSSSTGYPGTRADALLVLAQIAAYERNSSEASRRLAPGVLRLVERAIRAGLTAPETIVRMQAVKAIALMGNRDDLEALNRIAANDPYALSGAGPRGDETRFPIRDAARDASERLRLRLSRQPQ